METSKVAVALNPVPGFCVKSRATNDAPVHLTALDQQNGFHVENGLKIFVNIAWDSNIPPPPSAADDAIQRAMQGLDDESNPDAWFIPIVLSDTRQDSDKAGKSAIVFDCVLNPAIKSRVLGDPQFKNFVIGGAIRRYLISELIASSPELAFQRIEMQTTLVLSRQIGTPNIASKGKPRSRRVFVPTGLFPRNYPHPRAPLTLVQEIPVRTGVPEKASPEGILKKSPASQSQLPMWSWTQQASAIRIVFYVPGVMHSIIPDCTLDVEPRRIILHVPALYDLDMNLESLDSELCSIFEKNGTADAALRLKRMRTLDVDSARAEWRVADKAIVLLA